VLHRQDVWLALLKARRLNRRASSGAGLKIIIGGEFMFQLIILSTRLRAVVTGHLFVQSTGRSPGGASRRAVRVGGMENR
jgi:hypothetical protein